MAEVTLKDVVNSLGPNDAICWQRSGSTLAQVMACCLTAPSHYLNQCWLSIRKVQWYSYEDNFRSDISPITEISLKIIHTKFHWNLPGANELKSIPTKPQQNTTKQKTNCVPISWDVLCTQYASRPPTAKKGPPWHVCLCIQVQECGLPPCQCWVPGASKIQSGQLNYHPPLHKLQVFFPNRHRGKWTIVNSLAPRGGLTTVSN